MIKKLYIIACLLLVSTNLYSQSGLVLSTSGDPNGITNSPIAAGNIQTFERNYNPGSHNDDSFGYTSLSSATVGDGLPSTVKTIWVDTGSDLLLLANTNVTEDVTVNSGTFNIEDKVLQGIGTPLFELNDGARLIVGSTNNLANAIPGFTTYNWDANSEMEFNGTNQTISAFPISFNTSLGLGHLFLNNPGTKEVSSNMLVRGNLFVSNSAFLLNQSGVNNFQVRGNFENLNSGVINEGKIIIGQ